MSSRQEILNEINNMLNEVAPVLAVAAGIATVPVLAIGGTIKLLKGKLQDDPRYAQLLSQIPSSSDTKAAAVAIAKIVKDKTGVTAASEVGDEINRILKAIDDAGPKACNSFVFNWYVATGNSNLQEAMISNRGVLPARFVDAYYMPYVDVAKLGSGQKDEARTHIFNIWKKAAQAQPEVPTPPTPDKKTCPDGTPAPDGDVSKCKVSPAPKPGLKGPGCRPGSSFIGLNGITSGPLVTTLQQLLISGMLTGGKSLPQGVFDSKTEEAVINFQKEYGAKYAGKIKSQLGRNMPLDKVDGCVGPKTACALLIHAGSSGVSIAGYDIKKCKQKFGASKIAKGRIAANASPVDSTQAVAESKNWLDRTREETTSNLFERLVKDASKKVL